MSLLSSKATILANLRSAYNQRHQNNDLLVGGQLDRLNQSTDALPDLSRFSIGDVDVSGVNGSEILFDSHETSSVFSISPSQSPTMQSANDAFPEGADKAPDSPEKRKGIPPEVDDDDDDDEDDDLEDTPYLPDVPEEDEEASPAADVPPPQNEEPAFDAESDDDEDDEDDDDDDDDDDIGYNPDPNEPAPIDYELNIDDDSDFEEEFLRAAQQIKNEDASSVTLPGEIMPNILASLHVSRPRKSTSGSRLRSRRSSIMLAGNEESRASSRLHASKSNDSLSFARHDPPESTTPANSLLTSKLIGLSSGGIDPKEQYKEAIAMTGQPPVQVKIYLPDLVPVTIEVKRNCSVYLAIGYLLTTEQASRLPQLMASRDWYDANRWNLRLAEDDGSPDEDFPALDRARLIESYHDDFALVEARPDEFKDNSARTPNKVSFAAKKSQSSDNTGQSSPMIGAGTVTLKIYTYPYDPLLSEVYWEDGGSDKALLSEYFERLCRDKMLDPDMYVLRTVDSSHTILALSQPITSKMGGGDADGSSGVTVDFELTPKRALDKVAGHRSSAGHPAGHPTTNSQPSAAGAARRTVDSRRGRSRLGKTSISYPAERGDITNGTLFAMQPLGFYKYRIWRRQQMSFMGRHERELVIDGESIHIMPSSERPAIENLKTTSFQLKQVLRIKQSHKVPTNFKIMVMKTSGPKRYDLEGTSPAQTAEIVDRITRLRLKR